MPRYGDVYRPPPAPQQRRPSAILPAEVFPDPPVGSRGRQIVMAIVAAQWLFVPQPQQRRPTVTESGAVVEVFVPQSRAAQHRTILEQWRVDPQLQQRRPVVTSDTPSVFIPKARDYDRVITDAWHVDPVAQRSRPTAILPAEVFPDPPFGAQGRQYAQLVVASWRQAPQPQQRGPGVTESAVIEVFVPQSRVQDRLIIASWQTVPVPQRNRPTAILPAEVFPDPPVGLQRRQIVNALVVDQWRLVLARWNSIVTPDRQKRPKAILPAAVFDNPPIGQQRRQITHQFILSSWLFPPIPQRRVPAVTAGGVTFTAPFSGSIDDPTGFGGSIADPTGFGGSIADPTGFGGSIDDPDPA